MELAGRTVSHYRMIEKAGEGGMGEVWKAEDTRLKRVVALKFVRRDYTERFEREARAVAALDHPHVCAIHDVGEFEGQPYLVMQFVDGQPLRCPLPLSDALRIAVQVAGAVAAAHARGIVHRDLKPSNILVDKQGNAKVLDFGLAKMSFAEAGGDKETLSAPLETEENKIVGTIAYMSPEQAQGSKVDRRSDIFSFGSVLYEMVTGRQPFTGDSRMSTLAAIINREPKPIAGIIPAELERIVLKCLRKDPDRRFQYLDDVRSELEDLKEEIESRRSASGPPVESRRKRLMWASAATVLVLVAGTGIAFLMVRRAPPEKPFRMLPLTSNPGMEIVPSFSPDGNQVAYTGNTDDGNFDIYVKMIGVEKPLRLTADPAIDLSPAWSPDGRWIAFVRAGDENRRPAGRSTTVHDASLLVAPAIGGPEKKVAEVKLARGVGLPHLTWTPEGEWLAVTNQPAADQPGRLEAISVETGERRVLTNPPRDVTGDSTPAFSPDGKILAFSRTVVSGIAQIYLLRVAQGLSPAGTEMRLSPPEERCIGPSWTPDGREIVFSCGQPLEGLASHLWRMDPQRPSQAARQDYAGSESFHPAVARRGWRMAFSKASSDTNISAARISASKRLGAESIIIQSSRSDAVARFSPDGGKIVFTSNRSGAYEVWVCERDGSNPQQMTNMQATMTGSPRWSPDGRWISFDSNKGGRYAVYIMPSGGGALKKLTSGKSDDAVASWSNDGQTVFFGSNRTGRWEVWKTPAQGGPEVQVTRDGGRSPIPSPDGKRLYYQKGVGPSPLWFMPIEGGEEREVIRSTASLSFAVRPEGIYYIGRLDPSGGPALQFFRTANGKQEILKLLGSVGPGVDVSPDGQTIIYTTRDRRNADLMLVENFR